VREFVPYFSLCNFEKPVVKIKEFPEDFIVEEITKDHRQLVISEKRGFVEKEGKGSEMNYLHFVLQKKNWATDMAARKIAKALKLSKKRISFAGTKDKRAITVQLMSMYVKKKEKEEGIEKKLLDVKIKDIEILECYYSSEKVKLGDNKGNRFTIKLPCFSEKAFETLKEKGFFPNYHGLQRFGEKRQITHIVGYYILRNKFKEAVMSYLTFTSDKEREEVKIARERLANEQDFKKAANYFPKYLKHELMIINHLAKHNNDYVNALRKLPRQTLLMFVHAFQSYIFNIELAIRVKEKIEKLENDYFCKADERGFPLINEKAEKNGYLCMPIIGYGSTLNDVEKEILEFFKIKKDDFKIKSLPEISSKGSYRLAFSPFIDLFVSEEEEKYKITFKLPSGSYATVLINEIANIKDFNINLIDPLP